MKVGEAIQVVDPNVSSNGTNVHPALVTRVWGQGDTPTINAKVFPDCGTPYDATSIEHEGKVREYRHYRLLTDE